MAMIDLGMVQSLVVAAMVSGMGANDNPPLDLLMPGDPDPDPELSGLEASRSMVRLLAIDLLPQSTPRDNAGEADHAAISDIAVTLLVSTPPAVTVVSFGGIGQVLSLTAMSLAGKTLRDAGSTHQIDFDASPQVSTDPNTDAQRKMLTGVVVATGTVIRTSGASVASYVV